MTVHEAAVVDTSIMRSGTQRAGVLIVRPASLVMVCLDF